MKRLFVFIGCLVFVIASMLAQEELANDLNAQVSNEQSKMKTGFLVLKSDPDKAQVYLIENGVENYYGETPFQKKLPYGTYNYRIKKSLYNDEVGVVEVNNTRVKQEISLRPAIYGSLDVITIPMDVDITINGKNYGNTPTTIENLVIGEYDVVLSKEGFVSETHRVTITENNLSTIETTLVQGRKMTIYSYVRGDEVYIDGMRQGVTPLTASLSFGTHNIELRRGGKKVIRQVNVTPTDAETDIILALGHQPQWSSKATAEQKHILGKLIDDMVKVDGGTFTMGATAEQGSDAYDSEKPTHRVTLNTYYIGKYEVTQEQWEAVMGSNPSRFKGANKPVESVSWYDCLEFIEKLNQLTGLHFRLPTEAEWEYAARGGNKSKGFKYSGSNSLGNVAWYGSNSYSWTHIVGTKAPNELGIYDMSGNVREWCSDMYGDYSSSSQTNPRGPSSGSGRVIRGGSWFSYAQFCRVSYRYDSNPGSLDSNLGFRLVFDR